MSEVEQDRGTSPVPADVAVPVSSTARRDIEVAFGYNPDRDFTKLALEATYHSRGFRLVDKSALVAVPHVIIGVTYRPGYPRADKEPGDYVSVEAVVANKETLYSPQVIQMLRKGQGKGPDDLEVWGNESVVYNDSGTGIRRTLTELFDEIGIINVGSPNGDENVYDRQYQMWADGEDRATSGIVADLNGEPFRYTAWYGLRRSDYESPYGPATTYYLG
jgi:hypothetical protein